MLLALCCPELHIYLLFSLSFSSWKMVNGVAFGGFVNEETPPSGINETDDFSHLAESCSKTSGSLRASELMFHISKATLCNFDHNPRLRKTKMNDARSCVAQNSNFSKTGSYFTEKMSSGFPSDVLQLFCLSAAFYLAELSPTTTRCCSCSFNLQAAYTLLSGTSVNHRVEAEQSRTSEGKPQDIFAIKYDGILLKLLICEMY